MSANIIDGNKIANDIRNEVSEKVTTIKNSQNNIPGLAVVLIGNNPASMSYVRGKERDCEMVGIKTRTFKIDQNTHSHKFYRFINEIPTLLLILIVFVVVFKPL